MPVIVKPGSPGTPETRRRAEGLRDLHRGQLDRVRAAAEKWRDGLAVLLGLVTAVGVAKGRESVQDLAEPAAIVVGVLMLLALVCAAGGTVLAARAAFGLPRRRWLTGDPAELDDLREDQAFDAARDLRIAVVLTLATLAFLAGAVGLTLYGPTARSEVTLLRVTSAKAGQVCGSVTDSAPGRLSLKTDDGIVTVQLDGALVRVTAVC